MQDGLAMGRCVLIVEDEAAPREAMRDFFQAQGFAVDSARNLEEARHRLTAGTYAFVITDLRLGLPRDETGLDVVAAARSASGRMPVIVLSASAGDEVVRRSLERGANVVIRKPRSLWEIASVAAELMDRME